MSDIRDYKQEVLNDGFVRVVDTMGDDAAVVQAARVSYGDGTKHVLEDRGLIRYLMRHRHTSPFEMCEIKLHVRMPIFVARQWIRHRTASLNELSARYSEMPGEFFDLKEGEVGAQSKTNKQGRQGLLQPRVQRRFIKSLSFVNWFAYKAYEQALKKGVAREIARTLLPVGVYTEFYWKIDVHNLLHFLSLRLDPHAQREIRVYAEAIWDALKDWMPETADAFNDYVRNAETFSRVELQALARLTSLILADELDPSYFCESSGLMVLDRRLQNRVCSELDMSEREKSELLTKLRKIVP